MLSGRCDTQGSRRVRCRGSRDEITDEPGGDWFLAWSAESKSFPSRIAKTGTMEGVVRVGRVCFAGSSTRLREPRKQWEKMTSGWQAGTPSHKILGDRRSRQAIRRCRRIAISLINSRSSDQAAIHYTHSTPTSTASIVRATRLRILFSRTWQRTEVLEEDLCFSRPLRVHNTTTSHPRFKPHATASRLTTTTGAVSDRLAH